MSFDKLIFTLDDIRKVRKVSVNIDDFDMYAQEAQRNYLQKIIGDKLYTALQNDLDANNIPQTARFTNLVDGTIYQDGTETIFRGVKLYCCYVWLHTYIADSAMNVTPLGVRLFKDEEAEHNEAKESYRNAKAHYIAAADGLEEPILRFLSKNQNEYPEFSESYRIEPAEQSNNTFKVIGNTYTAPDNFLY